MNHDRLELVNALLRVIGLGSTLAIRVLVHVGFHVQLQRVLKSVIYLFAFPCFVVEVNSVETKSQYRR